MRNCMVTKEEKDQYTLYIIDKLHEHMFKTEDLDKNKSKTGLILNIKR